MLKDTFTGPNIIIWIIFLALLLLSITLLRGHGAGFIAGYNDLPDKKKEEYDEKKLCRVTGAGMLIIDIFILIAGLFDNVLPEEFSLVLLIVILITIFAILVLQSTICKKK